MSVTAAAHGRRAEGLVWWFSAGSWNDTWTRREMMSPFLLLICSSGSLWLLLASEGSLGDPWPLLPVQ